MNDKRVYKIIFHNQGRLIELHARHVGQSDLYGFVEIGELIFGERSTVLVDPSEEKLKGEFGGVQRSYIPIHAIVRIDQVEREGPNKIRALEDGSSVTPFPLPGLNQPTGKDSGGS